MELIEINMIALGYICLLPFIFFKKDGTFNLLWLMTAAPYVALEVFIIAYYFGKINLFPINPEIQIYLNLVGVFLSVIGICLISLTIGSHRIPLSLWHQNNDKPENIVKHGPYSKVRHPFYTSFILITFATFLSFPHFISLFVFMYTLTSLFLTAKKEEGKLSQSKFGEEYKDYMKGTGRFFPKLF